VDVIDSTGFVAVSCTFAYWHCKSYIIIIVTFSDIGT